MMADYWNPTPLLVADGETAFQEKWNDITNALDTAFDTVTVDIAALTASGALKAPLESPTFTGTVTVPTPTASTDAVSKAYADGLSFATVLPDQTGNSGKFITTDGSTASWASVQGGSTVTSGSADILLTVTSDQLQQVAMTAEDKSVTLPDAATLTEGIAYAFHNNGSYPWALRNTSGTLLGNATVGAKVVAFLVDNSTTDGTWFFGDYDKSLMEIFPGVGEVFSSTTTPYSRVAAMSATKSIVVYTVSGTGYAKVLTLSGTTLTAGAATEFDNNATYSDICSLDSTNAVVAYQDEGDSGKGKAVHLAIDSAGAGTTITAQTPVEFESSNMGDNQLAVCALSATSVLVVHSDSAADADSRALLISGSTITAPNAGYVFHTGTMYSPFDLKRMSNTTTLVSYFDNGTAHMNILTVATPGATPTKGAVVPISGSTQHPACAVLTSTLCIAVWTSSLTGQEWLTARLYDITTGVLVTVGQQFALNGQTGWPNSATYTSLTTLSSTKVLLTTNVSNKDNKTSTYSQILTIDATNLDITWTELVPLHHPNINADNYIGTDIIDANTGIVVYTDNSNSGYGTAHILEIAQ